MGGVAPAGVRVGRPVGEETPGPWTPMSPSGMAPPSEASVSTGVSVGEPGVGDGDAVGVSTVQGKSLPIS
jgi:hypothetical protein